MSRKLFNKLLSAILVFAICSAALCGSVVAVNAAVEDYSGTYTITVGDEKNAVPFGANKVTATVTFELPAGFASGEFTITSDSKYSGVSNLKIVDGTVEQLFAEYGVTFSPENFEKCELNGYVASFEDIDGCLYTSLTLQFDYDIATYIGNGTRQSYPVGITVDGSTFGVDTDYVNASFSAVGCDTMFHSHSAWSNVALDDTNTTAGDEQHTMIDAVCTYCESVNSDDNYRKYPQIIPDYTEFSDDLLINTSKSGLTADSNMGISGVTVDYRSDGTLDVNVHTYSVFGNALILVCDSTGKELYRTANTDNGTSNYANNGFTSSEKIYTLTGLSARDIDTQLYLTMVGCWNNSDAKTLVYSRTMPFKLADYCTSVIGDENGTELGNVVWGDASEEKKQADKDVAAALCYYSAAIDESVFEHVTANNGTIPGDTAGTTSNRGSDVWAWRSELSDTAEKGWGWYDPDLTVKDSTKDAGTETNPYIINNAEQLMYVLYSLGSASSGKYYKVSDDLGALYMTVNASNLVGKSAADVKEYFENTTDSLKAQPNGNTEGFQGTLDGNGVTIYGFNGVNNYYGGFIQFVDGNVTIKNLSIKNSYYKYGSNPSVGGIVGAVVSESGATLTIENCVVEDCYIESGVYFGAGTIAGKVKQNTVNIKNCIVADNTVNSTAVPERMGPIAYTGTSWGTMTASISDSIFINNNPYNQSNYGLSYPDAFTNVYTNVDMTNVLCGSSPWVYEETQVKQLASLDDIKGANATTNTSLDFESDWIAVDGGYPELSVFHQMQTVSTGNSSGHTEKCVIKLDGTSCNVKSPTVTPHDLTVEKEVDGVKYNTCSVCGWGKKAVGAEIVPVEKEIITWDGNISATPGEMDIDTWNITAEGQVADEQWFQDSLCDYSGDGSSEESPYIITTAAQLYYVTQLSRGYSAGKYYKIDDSIGVIDLNNNSWSFRDDSAKFQGTFDGNGVEIVNFKATGYHAALFPNVSGTVEIKNIKISGASITASGGNAGVLVATINGETASVSVKNCAVVDFTVTAPKSAGALIGTAGNGPYLTVENCFVSGAASSSSADTSTYMSNGLLGLGWNSANYTVSNSIILGVTPENRIGNFDNVYTDQTVTSSKITTITDLNTIKGSGVVDELGFDDSAWFATDSYPELHAMHSMVLQYTNDDSHKFVCADVIDGTACTTCGVETAHADAGNSTCGCGFVIEELIDTLALIKEKFPDSADAIISILLGSDEEETLYETAFATNVLFKNAYSADNSEINGTIDDCCLYATSLNLKTTPHIAFTFAFQGVYRENKSAVSATFTCGETTATVTADKMINNEGAGRYHLYRFKDLPVVNLCEPISVEVKYGDNTLVKGTYSAAGYAINAMDLGAQYKWHAEAAKALVYYSEMLAARYGSVE